MPLCLTHEHYYVIECSYCVHDLAKAEKAEQKASKKNAQLIEKQRVKSMLPRQKPKQVSDKQKEKNQQYAKVRDKFLNGRWCAYHGHGCIPSDVHHAKGRTGDLLTDTRYFVALCREAHSYVELHPNWAKENGYSESRLVTCQEKKP